MSTWQDTETGAKHQESAHLECLRGYFCLLWMPILAIECVHYDETGHGSPSSGGNVDYSRQSSDPQFFHDMKTSKY